MADDRTFQLENCKVILPWRNFSGEERPPFNKAGDRNFAVELDQEQATYLASLGYNVKTREAIDEGDAPTFNIQVKVKFKNRPPKVYMITSTGRTLLDEGLVGVLDSVDFLMVDIICVPFDWEIQATQKSGVSAYLKTGFFTIDEDPLELKYAQLELNRG